MAYFADLTPYEYGGAEPNPTVLNVGWLSSAFDFERQAPDEKLVAALRKLIAQPVNLYRGYHYCEFCPPPQFIRSATGAVSIIETHCASGNGEIRVNGEEDLIYVAPILILHYVEEHDYAPPEAFVRAVQRTA
jgi:hypothetical protein